MPRVAVMMGLIKYNDLNEYNFNPDKALILNKKLVIEKHERSKCILIRVVRNLWIFPVMSEYPTIRTTRSMLRMNMIS